MLHCSKCTRDISQNTTNSSLARDAIHMQAMWLTFLNDQRQEQEESPVIPICAVCGSNLTTFREAGVSFPRSADVSDKRDTSEERAAERAEEAGEVIASLLSNNNDGD